MWGIDGGGRSLRRGEDVSSAGGEEREGDVKRAVAYLEPYMEAEQAASARLSARQGGVATRVRTPASSSAPCAGPGTSTAW